MEGEGNRTLPMEDSSKGSSTKIIAIVIVLILVVAAIAGAFLLVGEDKKLPDVSISADSELVTAGEAVTFSVDFEDTDGVVEKYTWYFGDRSSVEMDDDESVTKTFDYPGSYLVILKVDGADDSKANWASPLAIEVTNAEGTDKPYAVVASDFQQVESETLVSFDAQSSLGYDDEGAESLEFVAEFNWDFGDGVWFDATNATWDATNETNDAATLKNHTYAAGDNSIFACTVTFTGSNGEISRFIITIVVTESATSGDVRNPDIFIMASIGEPEYLDYAVDYETSGGEIIQNVYETLVWYDGASAAILKPMLATEVPTVDNGGIIENGTVYIFHLRENVMFHNGEIMTSEDVKYSLERPLIINDGWGPGWILGQVLIPDYVPETEVSQADLDAAIWASDTMTVQLNLTSAYPAFIYCMAYTVASIVSKKYVMDNGGTQFVSEDSTPGNDFMAVNMCGTGAFMLNKWVKGQYIQLDRFDDYWQGPASLKHVLLKKVQNVNTREMLLFSGNADCVYIPRQHTDDVRGYDDLRIVEGMSTFNMDFIGFNQDINLTQAQELNMDFNVPATFFADKNVRMAMVHAFDYDSYIENILLGTAEQPNGVIPNGMWGYPADVPTYDYNLTLAAWFLNHAEIPVEYQEEFGATVWGDADITLTFGYNAGNTGREAACILFQTGLERLGSQGLINGSIESTVSALDWSGAYLPAVRNRALPVFFLGWAPDYADPDNYVNPFLYKDGTYAQRCSIFNETLSDMILDAAFELNETVRAELYEDISMGVYGEAYYCWTAQATNFHVERAWVSGYYFNPMYCGLYYFAMAKA